MRRPRACNPFGSAESDDVDTLFSEARGLRAEERNTVLLVFEDVEAVFVAAGAVRAILVVVVAGFLASSGAPFGSFAGFSILLADFVDLDVDRVVLAVLVVFVVFAGVAFSVLGASFFSVLVSAFVSVTTSVCAAGSFAGVGLTFSVGVASSASRRSTMSPSTTSSVRRSPLFRARRRRILAGNASQPS